MEGVHKRGNMAGKIGGKVSEKFGIFPQMLRGISAPLCINHIQILIKLKGPVWKVLLSIANFP